MMDIYVTIYLSKPIKSTIPRGNPEVNYGFGVMIMCQCWFILSKKCTILVRDVDIGVVYACERAEDILTISLLSFQYCCETKTALKMPSRN